MSGANWFLRLVRNFLCTHDGCRRLNHRYGLCRRHWAECVENTTEIL